MPTSGLSRLQLALSAHGAVAVECRHFNGGARGYWCQRHGGVRTRLQNHFAHLGGKIDGKRATGCANSPGDIRHGRSGRRTACWF
jgi:hypothetical protein